MRSAPRPGLVGQGSPCRILALRAAALLAPLLLNAPLRAGDTPPPSSRVHQLKVLSDRIDDVSTLDNIVRSAVRPGMSAQDRAKALWNLAIRYRHQAPPPNEFLAADWEAHDPVKLLNVYGYCMCCCSSALLEALNRADGRDARGRILNGHSVPEVFYGDAWHLFDASLITYFPRPADGVAASVDEIAAAVRGWHAEHPGFETKGQLTELMRGDGWSAWKAKGPELLASCPFYRAAYFPARTHGWDDTMLEYAREPREVYEYGYQTGHRALLSLRPGESFTREAGNRGLHVNAEQDPSWDGLQARAPENDLVYLKDFLPGYRGALVGNGVHRYEPDLRAGDLAAGAETLDNLVPGAPGEPALKVADPSRPGVAVIEMSAPFVYLDSRVTLRAVRPGAADRVRLSISTNNGRSFEPVWEETPPFPTETTLRIGPRILRRYAYWLRLEVEGRGGVESLRIENDFQHSPRTLSWLAPGKTAVTVAADGDTALATRTVNGRITPEAGFTKNETTATLGATFDNLDLRDGSCWWRSGTGTMTVPVEVPGDLALLRFCAQVRARGEEDTVRIAASTDAGATWRDLARIDGPTPGTTRSFRAADWPPGTRKLLLRFVLSGNNTVGLFSFRIDADYRDPLAGAAFRPFDVTHRWNESGTPRSHTERITRLPHTYTIEAADPEMASVTCSMPSGR